MASANSTAAAATTAQTSTPSEAPKDADNASQSSPVKTQNGGYRQGGGKRMMMTGYRPMYPLQMKSEICEDFTKGTCSRGSRCPFLHVAAAGSTKALSMTRNNMGHANVQKTAAKTETQGDGTKKASKKKKKKNAAKKAQENAAAAEGADAAASTTTAAATTAAAPSAEGGEEKPNTATEQQAGKGKKSKNQRRQNQAAEGGAAAAPAEAQANATAANAKQTGRKHRAQGAAARQTVGVPNVGNAVCVNYVLGVCRFGRSCEFLHPEGALNPAGMICPFYASGSCGYGLNCIFAHVLPTDPAYHMKPCLLNRMGTCPNGDACVFYHEKPNPARALDSRSTVPCSFWVRGYCAKGEKCPFAHPDEYWMFQSPFERTPASGSAAGADDEQKKDKSKVKSDSATGDAKNGTVNVPKNQIACKFWAQGNCPAGDKCEYRHDLFLHSTNIQ